MNNRLIIIALCLFPTLVRTSGEDAKGVKEAKSLPSRPNSPTEQDRPSVDGCNTLAHRFKPNQSVDGCNTSAHDVLLRREFYKNLGATYCQLPNLPPPAVVRRNGMKKL